MYILHAYYQGKLEFMQTFETMQEAKLKRTNLAKDKKSGWTFKITYQQN